LYVQHILAFKCVLVLIQGCCYAPANKNTPRYALINSGISQIDNIAPFEFEEWVARLLKTAGYNAIATKNLEIKVLM
jgi:HJR/Mrr/RecB family endonuclease